MGAESVPLALAFLAGTASFLSPCHLAVVPAFLTVLGGSVVDGRCIAAPDRAVLIRHAALFIVGFSLVMIALGMSVGLAGYLVYDRVPLLRKVGGVLLLIFGLHTLGMLRVPLLYRELRWRPALRRLPRDSAALVTGVAFGVGWTPCVGPVLAAILLLAAETTTVWQGGALLALYAAGLSLPFFGLALLLDRSPAVVRRLRSSAATVQMTTGVMLLALGVLVYTNQLQRVAALVGGWSPL